MAAFADTHPKDEGIVLRKKKLLGDDVLIVVETMHNGKCSFIVKGVRKLTSKRISYIQTGNIISFDFSPSRSGPLYLKNVNLISHLFEIKNIDKKRSLLYMLLFLFDRLLPDQNPEKETYLFCRKKIVGIHNLIDINPAVILGVVNSILTHFGYMEQSNLADCKSYIEEIIGKKIPEGVL